MGSQLSMLAIETRKITGRITAMESDIVNLKLQKKR
jgi:hypothetical protein